MTVTTIGPRTKLDELTNHTSVEEVLEIEIASVEPGATGGEATVTGAWQWERCNPTGRRIMFEMAEPLLALPPL